MNPLALFSCAVAVAASGFAGSDHASCFEHAAAGHTVRISRGPGEFESIGSYAIRVYDAGNSFIAGLVRPRDGALVRSWVTGPGTRGHFQVWIWTRASGSGAYGELECFDYDGATLRPLPLADPDDALLEGYRGHDQFEVRGDKVYRRFPLYRDPDCNAEPTGGTRCLELDVKPGKWRLSAPRGQLRPDNGRYITAIP